jgi:hypothetical protein
LQGSAGALLAIVSLGVLFGVVRARYGVKWLMPWDSADYIPAG